MNPIRVITPDSESDLNYEEFEYLIEWYSLDASYYQRMFTDWDNSHSVSNDVTNRGDSAKIKNTPIAEDRTITVTFEDITLNDLNEYKTILKAPLINRVLKDGSRERLAIEGQRINYGQTETRYNFSVTLIQYEQVLPR